MLVLLTKEITSITGHYYTLRYKDIVTKHQNPLVYENNPFFKVLVFSRVSGQKLWPCLMYTNKPWCACAFYCIIQLGSRGQAFISSASNVELAKRGLFKGKVTLLYPGNLSIIQTGQVGTCVHVHVDKDSPRTILQETSNFDSFHRVPCHEISILSSRNVLFKNHIYQSGWTIRCNESVL